MKETAWSGNHEEAQSRQRWWSTHYAAYVDGRANRMPEALSNAPIEGSECSFCLRRRGEHRLSCVALRALRDLVEDEEIYVQYGTSGWVHHRR
jgi:hypothetical protein